MTRRIFLAAVGSVFLRRLPPAQPAEDSQAVLSALIPILQPAARQYLIFDTTIVPELIPSIQPADTPLSPLKRSMTISNTGTLPIAVPPQRQPQFRELLASFAVRKNETAPIMANLKLPKPFLLLNESDRRAYLGLEPPSTLAASSAELRHGDKALAKEYENCGPLYALSEVYFDRASKLAMVWTRQVGNCGFRTWHVLEKLNGTWRPVPWETGGISYCA